jgi:hypothetical protein
MYTCPHCHTKTFGLWPVLHARPGQVLTCGHCQERVHVKQPGMVLTLIPIILGQLALSRSGDNFVLGGAILLMMFAYVFLLLYRCVSLTSTPPGPNGL